MPILNIVTGPGGSLVDFSSLPIDAKFTQGGLICSKKDDSYCFDLSNGQIKPITGGTQVQPIAVSWTPTAYAIDDCQGGDIWYDVDGLKWVKVDGGAINTLDGKFTANGGLPPLKSIAKTTELNPDL